MPGSDEQTIVTEEIIDNSEVIPENQMETAQPERRPTQGRSRLVVWQRCTG